MPTKPDLSGLSDEDLEQLDTLLGKANGGAAALRMTAFATGPYSLDEYRLAVEAERAKRSLRVFMKLAWNQVDPDAFVPNWHVDCMADHLEAWSHVGKF